MAAHKSDVPGSGIDQPPPKTLTEKVTDTVKAIIKPSEKTGNSGDDTGPKKDG
jgi:hypothetical protein